MNGYDVAYDVERRFNSSSFRLRCTSMEVLPLSASSSLLFLFFFLFITPSCLKQVLQTRLRSHSLSENCVIVCRIVFNELSNLARERTKKP